MEADSQHPYQQFSLKVDLAFAMVRTISRLSCDFLPDDFRQFTPKAAGPGNTTEADDRIGRTSNDGTLRSEARSWRSWYAVGKDSATLRFQSDLASCSGCGSILFTYQLPWGV